MFSRLSGVACCGWALPRVLPRKLPRTPPRAVPRALPRSRLRTSSGPRTPPTTSSGKLVAFFMSFLGLSRLSCNLCLFVDIIEPREAPREIGSRRPVSAHAASRHCEHIRMAEAISRFVVVIRAGIVFCGRSIGHGLLVIVLVFERSIDSIPFSRKATRTAAVRTTDLLLLSVLLLLLHPPLCRCYSV